MTTEGTEFPITWYDPAEAEQTWYRDDMHMPHAQTRLSADYVRLMGRGMRQWHASLENPVFPRMEFWNGYAYYGVRIDAPEAEQGAVWDRSTEASRAQYDTIAAEWRDRMIPTLIEHRRVIDDTPVATLPATDLAVAWDDAWDRTETCWGIHFIAIRGPYQVLEDLADLYEQVVPDAGPGDAVGLIAGGIDELQDVERRLEELAAMVAGSPSITALLARPDVTLDELAAAPDGADFHEALEAFLAMHGHLGQPFDDLGLPSWVEAPDVLLRELRKRADHPTIESSEARRHRLAAAGDLLADGARTRLADDPERLATFDRLLAVAREIGGMTETHNYWIDRMAQSTLRRFVVRVGARLVEAGVFDRPEDVLCFDAAEVRALILEPVDQRAVVRERTAELERQTHLRAPATVGVAPPEGDDETDRFDGARFTSDIADEIKGTGASAGSVRGRARVTLDEAAFDRVQPGDIIVCPSSNPSWVPLFAIAGGLITNTGGVLSHAAVVAREFGLPAVVGTGDATERIADGRTVELDGATGIVRLL